jgi:ubiquinone/menaquinone biosynthesis C-methylase UbiE
VDRLLEATHTAERAHFWYQGFAAFTQPLLDLAASGIANPRLLDCGCGTGANLRQLQRRGRATGIEVTWRGLEFARQHGLRSLAQATAAALPFPNGTFDVVTSFDVLYCLPDDVESAALAEMRRVLKPGGALLVNVAALEMLRGDHSALDGELRRYTTHSLRARLDRTGFEIRRLTYTNATIFPLVAAGRAWQRLRGVRRESTIGDFHVPPAPINAALAALLRLEATALRWIDMPFGTSVLCLARKTPRSS